MPASQLTKRLQPDRCIAWVEDAISLIRQFLGKPPGQGLAGVAINRIVTLNASGLHARPQLAPSMTDQQQLAKSTGITQRCTHACRKLGQVEQMLPVEPRSI